MPRLIRRKPLWERITAALNPMDFLLWLSEELETRDWDSTAAGTQLGLGLNFVFLVARANHGTSRASDDVFTDDSSSGWLSFFIYPIVWSLLFFSFTNAFYTITRTRKYRLFQANVEVNPSTPNAKRVKVDSGSTPISSPLQYIASVIAPDTPESRAHPDKTSDVWELSVWDPLPVSLRLFCLFGPGHVLVYMMFLPLAPLDPRPSVTVFNTLILQAVISGQLLFFCSRFAQQAKDHSVIQKEVMHEYDTKFVHPRVYPEVRDAGTQISENQPAEYQEFVQVGTPTTQIKRKFQIHGNPYVKSAAPEERTATPTNVMRPQMFTPPAASQRPNMFNQSVSHRSTPRHSLPASYASTGTPAAATTTSSAVAPNTNFGGSLGVYTHNKSPLKKATSLNELNSREAPSPRNSREMAALEQRSWGQTGTPSRKTEYKRPNGSSLGGAGNPFGTASKKPSQHDRYSSRW